MKYYNLARCLDLLLQNIALKGGCSDYFSIKMNDPKFPSRSLESTVSIIGRKFGFARLEATNEIITFLVWRTGTGSKSTGGSGSDVRHFFVVGFTNHVLSINIKQYKKTCRCTNTIKGALFLCFVLMPMTPSWPTCRCSNLSFVLFCGLGVIISPIRDDRV